MALNVQEHLIIEAKRLFLRPAESRDIEAIIHLYRENAAHLAASAPKRNPEFLTNEYWQNQIKTNQADLKDDRAVRLFVFTSGGVLIGFVNFTAILRGASHFCYLGYGISKAYEGQGLMSEAVRAGINFMFEVMNLHRIMANFMPANERSGRLLQRLGFVEEGFAKDYLFLDGAWRDHVMTSLTNSAWREK
jgi:ribosomal-protein-alanine N-acetyltransferase